MTPASVPEVRPRPLVRGIGAATVLGLVALAAYALFGAWASHPHLFNDWVITGVVLGGTALTLARVVLVEEERTAWLVLAAGLSLYSLGTVLWSFWLQNLAHPRFPRSATPCGSRSTSPAT